MQILYSPQRSSQKVEYKFDGEIITTTIQGQTDVFNFTNMPDGILQNVVTELAINPILSAKRENGELFVELLYWYGENPTQEELFPQWQVID